jgi:hypothetical protein
VENKGKMMFLVVPLAQLAQLESQYKREH